MSYQQKANAPAVQDALVALVAAERLSADAEERADRTMRLSTRADQEASDARRAVRLALTALTTAIQRA